MVSLSRQGRVPRFIARASLREGEPTAWAVPRRETCRPHAVARGRWAAGNRARKEASGMAAGEVEPAEPGKSNGLLAAGRVMGWVGLGLLLLLPWWQRGFSFLWHRYLAVCLSADETPVQFILRVLFLPRWQAGQGMAPASIIHRWKVRHVLRPFTTYTRRNYMIDSEFKFMVVKV